MNDTRYRIMWTALGLALIGVIVLTLVLTPSGPEASLPEPVESIFPTDNAIVQRQVELRVDLQPGYRLDLVIDGVPIPESELTITEPTGLFIYRPGPGKTFSEWTPGFHVVEIAWDRRTGLPDPGSMRWTFRVL